MKRHTRRIVRRAAAERGFTMIEVLVAMALMSVGIAATLGVFGSSGRTTVVAQRTEVAVHKAQGELDRLSQMNYDELGMTSTPASSSNPMNPGLRVSGTTFTVRTGLTESFVLSTDSGESGAAVDPTPSNYAVGVGGATVSGKIYRYVTWRDENCPATVCDGTHNTKRITVAATLDTVGTLPARAPVWVSQVIPDPEALPPGASAPPSSGGGTSDLTAQDFYLYDTRCGNNTRQAQTGDHLTHNTASTGPSPTYNSICENTSLSGAMQPDLMGKDDPPGDNSTPMYTYSSELSGSYDGGLAMKRQGNTCRTYYAASDTINPNAPNAWSLHAWSTSAFASGFDLNGQVTLSLFTSTLGGAAGRGYICATLVDRTVLNGVPQDTVLGTGTYDIANWPTDMRRLSFTYTITKATVPQGHRLVLVLGVRAESDNDLVFLYDHPLYPSFLEVATTTPL